MKEEKESKPHIKEEVTSRKKQKLLGIDSSNKNKANEEVRILFTNSLSIHHIKKIICFGQFTVQLCFSSKCKIII